jgi:hypothetical protein
MFEDSSMWITGITKEEIKNHTICVYHSNDKSLTNLKNRDEIATEVFVFVDAHEWKSNDKSYQEEYIPDIIQPNICVRCLRIHILA